MEQRFFKGKIALLRCKLTSVYIHVYITTEGDLRWDTLLGINLGHFRKPHVIANSDSNFTQSCIENEKNSAIHGKIEIRKTYSLNVINSKSIIKLKENCSFTSVYHCQLTARRQDFWFLKAYFSWDIDIKQMYLWNRITSHFVMSSHS